MWKHWSEMLKEYPGRPDGLEIFTDESSSVKLNLVKEIAEADIINLHWVAGMINFDELPLWSKTKKIVWTLHDMNAFTGGCHYSSGCEKYLSSCSSCPQLGSNVDNDLSKGIFQIKQNAYNNLKINVVTPSKWLGDEAKNSFLFSKYNVDIIRYGLPLNVFEPINKFDARKWAKISYDSKVILFGADSLTNKRKGFKYLVEALNLIDRNKTKNILLLTFGSCPDNLIDNSKYQVINLGTISEEKTLAAIYSIADVYVIPSLEDNLPNTILESLACGTPVVGFNVGGIPDMIEHKKNGYLAIYANPVSIAEGIIWILQNSNNHFRDYCRTFAEINFNSKIQAEAYLKLYQNLHVENKFNFNEIRYSLKTQFNYFKLKKYDIDLYGKEIDPLNCDLKVYQDLLVFTYIKENLPKGSKLLDIGGGNSRILTYFTNDYECWNLDKFEGIGNGLKNVPNVCYKMVQDYIGNFNSELPENYFDFVFSISTLEHVGEDIEWYKKICLDIDRVSKNDAINLHCFDVVLNSTKGGEKYDWTCGLLPFMFRRYHSKQGYSGLNGIINDNDLFFLSQDFYKNNWQKVTKQEYSDFGVPISYNIFWQIKKHTEVPEIIFPKHNFKKISIVTPSFNQAEFLEETIDSVLSQNYPNLEYVIMDGGSFDGSVEIIKKYEKYLSYWQSKPDGGQYEAINNGLGKTSGEIMGWINSDDKLHYKSLFKINEAFAHSTQVRWITGRPTAWNTDGTLNMISPKLPNWSREKILNKEYKDAFIQQESTFWLRSLWEEAGGYISTESQLVGDFELWLRFFRFAELFTVNDLLGGYRYQPKQKTATLLNKYIEEADSLVESEIGFIKEKKFIRNKPFPGIIKINPDAVMKSENNRIDLIDANDFVLATSLNPRGGNNQLKAYKSWLDSGFKVVSFNCEEEVQLLKPVYGNVIFYTVNRTAYSKVGKHLVYLDDIIKELKKFPNQNFGLINSDITLDNQLINGNSFKTKLKEYLKKGILYSNRIDIENSDFSNGNEYEVGYDLFFFTQKHLEKISGLDLIIGLPWWDYYFLLAALFNLISIIKINEKIAYHVKHTSFYNEEIWFELGGTVLDFTKKMMDSINNYDLFNFNENDIALKNSAIFNLSRVCLGLIKKHSKLFSNKQDLVNEDEISLDPDSDKMIYSRSNDILISAIVSTYNSEKFIEGCLNDLINQSIYKKGQLEIVVVDSASLENEKAIVEDFQSKYANIIYQRTTERESLYAAWNRGIKLARGKYITNANTDDRHCEDALEIMAGYLEKNQSFDLVYANSKISLEENETFDSCISSQLLMNSDYDSRNTLLHYQFGPTPLWRKNVHEKIGYFDENYRAVGDYEFNIRFAVFGLKAKYLNETLSMYYKNPNSITLSFENQGREKEELLNYYRTPQTISKLYQQHIEENNDSSKLLEILQDQAIRALSFHVPGMSKRGKDEKYFSNLCASSVELIKSQKINPEKKLVILVDQNNFNFIYDFLFYLTSKSFVLVLDSNDEQQLQFAYEWADTVFIEWMQKIAYMFSNLNKKQRIITRLHSYEAFDNYIKHTNLQNIDDIVFVSEVMIDYLRSVDIDIRNKSRVHIIPPGIDLTKFTFKKRKHGFNIAFVGHLIQTKNIAFLLQIMKMLTKKDNKYKLHVFGEFVSDSGIASDIPKRYFLDQVNKLGLSNNVTLYGYVEHNQIVKEMSEINYILSTSYRESLGLNIIEAMAIGIMPIIHSWPGAESIYPEDFLFSYFEEIFEKFELKYESKKYREFVIKNYDCRETHKNLTSVILNPHNNSFYPENETGKDFSTKGNEMIKSQNTKTIKENPVKHISSYNLKILYLAFASPSSPQVMEKIHQQLSAMKKYNSESVGLVIGWGNLSKNYSYQYVNFQDYNPNLDFNQFALTLMDEYASRINADIIYFRYPASNQFLHEFVLKHPNVVFEHQTKELNEFSIRKDKDYYYYNEQKYGGKVLSKALGITTITNDVAEYEQKRAGRDIDYFVFGNGTWMDAAPIVKDEFPDKQINILFMGSFAPWHGVDRVIKGLSEYKGISNFKIHMVGNGEKGAEYIELIKHLKLERNFIFYGFKSREEINKIANICHLAIGSLGLHRIGFEQVAPLKHREYCLRGIPFIYSGNEVDFSSELEFVHQVQSDDSNIDFVQLENFARLRIEKPAIKQDARNYALTNLTWEIKIKGMIDFLIKLKNYEINACLKFKENNLQNPASIIHNHADLYSPIIVNEVEKKIFNKNNNSNKKILIACTHFWPSIGGVETITENLGCHLVEEGYIVEIATLEHANRVTNEYQGMRIHSLKQNEYQNNIPSWTYQLRQLIVSGNYSACILFSNPTTPLIWSIENAEIPIHTKVFIQPIINIDDYSGWRNNENFDSRLTGILKNATAVIKLTESGIDTSFLKNHKIPAIFIPNATNPLPAFTDFRKQYNIPADSFLIIHVANLYNVKNHTGILRAIKSLPDDCRLVMIGYPTDQQDYIKDFKEELKSNNNFIYIPGLSQNGIAEAMEAADLLILASHGEVSPVCIMEAMSHRTPWLATHNCGTVNEMAGGIVTELDKFSELINYLKNNRNLLDQLSKLGYEHWEACYSWDIVIKGWKELIENGRMTLNFLMPNWIAEEMEKLKSKIESSIRFFPTTVSISEKMDKDNSMNITAIISAYNEGDVIFHVIKELVEQEIKVYLIDHHSTDNTVEEASKLLGKGLIKIETFPEESGFNIPDNVYTWRYILQRKEQISKELGDGWYIHADADEFRESPWFDLTLRKGIEKVDSEGYNAINFKIYDFKPIDNKFKAGLDVRKQLKYYSDVILDVDNVQVKCWKYSGQVFNLWKSGGHIVEFEERKIYPIPFILRHYPIRSQEHGEKKIFKEKK